MTSRNVSASVTALTTVKKVEAREWFTQLLAGACVGLFVGAVVGGFLFSAMAADTTATALVRIKQQPDLVAIAGGAVQSTPVLPDNTERYVAGEVAYLTGDGFAQTVGARLGKTKPPKLKVVQEGRSSVVSITNTSPSRTDAIRAVQTAIDVYAQQVSARIDRQLQGILPRLDRWEQTALGPDDARTVREVRERVQLQAAEARTLPLLEPPTPDYVSSHRTLIGAFLGGFLGAALAPLVLMARRKRSGRLFVGSGASGLTDSVDGILVPVVDLQQGPRSEWGDAQITLGRKLYAQLGAPAAGRTIVFIGVSQSSGTSTVAALLELAAAEHGPVQLTNVPISRPNPETTVIVKAGSVGTVQWIPEAIASATDLVLVSRIGVDTEEQFHVAGSATASRNAHLSVVFTSLPWWYFRRIADEEPVQHADSPDE